MRRGGALVVFAVVLAGAFVFGSATGLRVQHALRMELARFASVAVIEVEPVGKFRMFLNPDDAAVTRAIMAAGVWEENETHWFTKFVDVGDTVIDVGANVGYYTILASRLVGERGRVYAFEPDPTSFALLEQNVRVNGARNVVLEQKALSNENGTLQLYLAEKNKGDHRIYQTEEDRPSVDVETVRLDDYLADVGGTVDFVKIDTQGAEAVIIAGMPETIRANPGIVMAVEFWPEGLLALETTAEGMLEELRGHDFRMFDLGLGMLGTTSLREVAPEGLLKQYTSKGWSFTNLLLIKGFAQLRQLTWEVAAKRSALERELARGESNSDRQRDARAALALAEAALVAYRDGAIPQ